MPECQNAINLSFSNEFQSHFEIGRMIECIFKKKNRVYISIYHCNSLQLIFHTHIHTVYIYSIYSVYIYMFFLTLTRWVFHSCLNDLNDPHVRGLCLGSTGASQSAPWPSNCGFCRGFSRGRSVQLRHLPTMRFENKQNRWLKSASFRRSWLLLQIP